jgi:ABC-type transporter Mla subunit MlaD
MFGRKTKRQLVQASEIITEALETAKALASRLEETERQRSETLALLNRALANTDGVLATVATWRQLCEAAQNGPVEVQTVVVPYSEWMN